MFDVNEKLVANSLANGYEITEQDVTRSIDHFYYFWAQHSECVLPLKLSSMGHCFPILVLILTLPSSFLLRFYPLPMTSYYSLLEDDFYNNRIVDL